MTRLFLHKSVAVVAGIAVAGLVAVAAQQFFANRHDSTTYLGEPIPKGGLHLNKAGLNLGDPANAEADMKRVYEALIQFRGKYGRLPNSPWELLDAGRKGLVSLKPDDLINPDVGYSDNEAVQQGLAGGKEIPINASYGFEWLANQDSTGAKVKWLSSSCYVRINAKAQREGKFDFEPKGFYIFLYSDGSIKRVSLSERRMVREGLSWRPLRDDENPGGRKTMSEEEFYKRLSEKGGSLMKM
jgi:hypothetical protein